MRASGNDERAAGPLYVYAIIPSAPGTAIPRVEGVADRLSTIDAGGYAAVVGDAAANLKGRGREELGRLLVDHQKVVEQIMRATPLLPVQFGTQVPDEPGVRTMLEHGAPLFDDAFAEFGGCSQLEILVTWDVAAVLAELAAEEPLAGWRASLAATPSAPSAAREEFGRRIKEALDAHRATIAQRFTTLLQGCVTDTLVHPPADDRVVLQIALLVHGDALAAVDAWLEMLDKEYGGRLHFRCVGPMPPSSFAAVRVDVFEAEAIARAGHILGVDGDASPDDVRAAYLRGVKAMHPDADGGEAQPMVELTEAYRMLSVCARNPAHAECDDAAAGPRAVVVSLWRPEPSAGADMRGTADA